MVVTTLATMIVGMLATILAAILMAMLVTTILSWWRWRWWIPGGRSVRFLPVLPSCEVKGTHSVIICEYST